MRKIEFKKLQNKEAVERLKDLTKTFNLNNKLVEDFEIGKINCTLDGKLCDIKEYPKFKRLIKKFERINNAVVYYSFLTEFQNMRVLVLLYVGHFPVSWEAEHVFYDDKIKKYPIDSFIYFLDTPKYSDYGYIFISSKNGILTKID